MARGNWERYDAAFKQVGAHAVLLKGEHVANIAIKYPRDGAARLTAFVHWIGIEVAHGFVSGYGYDKTSAAIEKIGRELSGEKERMTGEKLANFEAFKNALSGCDNGSCWNEALTGAGFVVLGVIG